VEPISIQIHNIGGKVDIENILQIIQNRAVYGFLTFVENIAANSPRIVQYESDEMRGGWMEGGVF
jgi:hypothetical protein